MRPGRRRVGLVTYLVAALVALLAIAAHAHGPSDVLPQSVLAVATAGAADVTLRSALTGVRTFPKSAVVTGLIVGLLLTPGRPWYVAVAAAALAIGSKHVVRWRGRNVFNPAGLGMAAAVLLFAGPLDYGHPVFLEGAPRLYYAEAVMSMDDWSFVLAGGHGWTGSTSAVAVAALGAVLVRRMRRHILVAVFLGTYAALVAVFALLAGQDLLVRLVLETFASGAPFFAFFMLTDPATSPQAGRELAAYGVLVALLAFAFRFVVSPVLFLLAALLVANVLLAIWSQRPVRLAAVTLRRRDRRRGRPARSVRPD